MGAGVEAKRSRHHCGWSDDCARPDSHARRGPETPRLGACESGEGQRGGEEEMERGRDGEKEKEKKRKR